MRIVPIVEDVLEDVAVGAGGHSFEKIAGRERHAIAGRGEPVAIPVDASGEAGVLARAFARVMGDVNAKTTALEREIQEHRRTEAARDHHAARERLFSAAVESSNDAIVTKSLDGAITGWNPAAERLFGFTATEAVGNGIHIIVPNDRLAEVHDILRRIGRGEGIQHLETVRLRKDGTPVEVSLSLRSPTRSVPGSSTTRSSLPVATVRGRISTGASAAARSA